MATPPTFSVAVQTSWNSATTPLSTGSFSAAIGDVFAAAAGAEHGDGAPNFGWSNTGINQTWAEKTAIPASPGPNQAYAQACTTTVANTLTTQTISLTFNTSAARGTVAAKFTGSAGIGNTNQGDNGTSSAAPSFSFTTAYDNSAVFVFVVDWNAAGGGSRVWRTVNGYTPTAGNGQEIAYYNDGTKYGLYGAYYPDVGAAGAKTLGLTNPSTCRWVLSAVEIRGGALTQVTSTRATTWATLAPVTSTRQTAWTTRAWLASASTRATTWTVLVPIASPSTRQTTWETLQAVTSTRATTWATIGQITSTRQTTWKTLAPVTSTRATQWATLAPVTATRATQWAVLSVVSASTRATTWAVLTATTSMRATTWATLSPVTSTRATTWATDAPVTSSRATSWTTLQQVTTTRADTWAVEGTATSVTSTRATTWAVLGQVASTRATSWTVTVPVAPSTRATEWAVLTTLPAASTRATQWETFALVTSTRAETWAVVSAITGETIWPPSTVPGTPSAADWSPVGLGVKFSSSVPGTITTIQFYKGGVDNAGPHTVALWDFATGTALSTGTAAGESDVGWQTVPLDTPVPITAGTSYVASYWAPSGRYSADAHYFDAAYTSGDITVPIGGGTFTYTSAATMPDQSFNNTNYWVDIQLTIQVTATRATQWDTLAQVTTTRATEWDVEGPLSQVTSTRATSWAVASQVTSTRQTGWDTLAQVTDTQTTSWAVLAQATSTRHTEWAVESTIVSVTSTRSTTWAVIGQITSSRQTAWTTLARVTSSRATTWTTWQTPGIITRSTQWAVLTQVAPSTRQTAWAVAGQVISTRQTTWAVAGQVTSTRATRWDTLGVVSATRITTWTVLTTVASSTRTDTWGVLSEVTSTRSEKWDVHSLAIPAIHYLHGNGYLFIGPRGQGTLSVHRPVATLTVPTGQGVLLP